jgi:hypothetical protein
MQEKEKARIQVCQSCGSAPVEAIVDVDDTEDPYLICKSCRDRLFSYNLRPREWYNLSSLHGHLNDLLDSEHYGENGTALQPSTPVTNPDLFPCPTLEHEQTSPEHLLTYVLALDHWYEYEGWGYRWTIDISLINALKSYSPEILLPIIHRRLTMVRNADVIRRIFQIAGLVLGSTGAPLVRDHWDEFAPTFVFPGIAFAATQCLPVDEAYQQIADRLSKMTLRDRCASKDVLRWLKSQHTLDWIEQNGCSPVDITWGPLAASSQFDWERAKKWLSLGRPLSLIALDALSWCLRGDSRMGPLLNPPNEKEFTSTLKNYLDRDNVLRVRESISGLLGYAHIL